MSELRLPGRLGGAPARVTALLAGVLLSAACGAPAEPTQPLQTLRLMTHDSFSISDEVLAEFEQQHGVTVEILRAGDGGSMVNQAILTRDAPLAHVLFGVDNTFLSRALESGIFTPYRSPALADVPAELQLDPQYRVTPIDYGDVCLNIDRSAFPAGDAPATLEELADPRYEGMLVVQNPATSTPGLAFLLATVQRFGEEGGYTWRDYWADLRANDVLVTAGWEDAYYGSFSGGAGEGDRPIVVSYATSPAAEVYFADPPPAEAPTAAVFDGCFRQVEFAGILSGSHAGAVGQAFIDFMLSTTFQEDIPLNMFVFPANREAELPEVFATHGEAAPEPITLDHERIGEERERWIEEWTDVVLR
ncbi:MAG TPA: thiamine ABC transporter substrate-binding protein [Candidatus Limnocylindria bacterium]|nr:thiamine ABC transporter substrate-binding protein [Candidatus Limnocylindria bacterium]